MTTDPLRYDKWIEEALRAVIRRAVTHAATHGLPGDHHFYLTFRTGDPGVVMPAAIRALHPDEMTIVLQHQFWDLEADRDAFRVTLRFKGKSERLTVPFAAITAFSDPAVNFGLQLKTVAADDAAEAEAAAAAPPPGASDEGNDDAKVGEVIALDSFRKK